jgi:hypothetical protein
MPLLNYECLHCGKTFQAKRPAKFCCTAHRAAYHKQTAGTIPGKICSATPTAEGATVVVVRVPPDFRHKCGGLLPRAHIDLLERRSEGDGNNEQN